VEYESAFICCMICCCVVDFFVCEDNMQRGVLYPRLRYRTVHQLFAWLCGGMEA
jgi:hypothetical protein